MAKDDISGPVLTSSAESQGSSRAVLNDSATEPDNREGIRRCGGLKEAGGVTSGVGGLLCDLEALPDDRAVTKVEVPFDRCSETCGTLSRELNGGVGGNARPCPLGNDGDAAAEY
jgi:hypothetical protein